MRRMINGERKEGSIQKKLHFPNGMGDVQLNRKKKGRQDHRTNFSNKLMSVDNTQLEKMDCWVEEFFEKRYIIVCHVHFILFCHQKAIMCFMMEFIFHFAKGLPLMKV